MKVISENEFDLIYFDAWSGAKSTKERIINEGKSIEFNDLMSELYPNGASETTINDLLWHDTSWVYEHLGIEE